MEDKEEVECLTSVSVGLYSSSGLAVLQVVAALGLLVSCPAPPATTKSSINFYKPNPAGLSSAF